MSRIAEHAGDVGVRFVNTFVDEISPASAKGCVNAGFIPCLRRTETFRLFRRDVRYRVLIED
jgi:hypothetical protein